MTLTWFCVVSLPAVCKKKLVGTPQEGAGKWLIVTTRNRVVATPDPSLGAIN